MENPIDPKLIGDLKRASQEIEGVEEVQPQVSPPPLEEGAKEKQKPVGVSKPPHQEIGGGGKEVSRPEGARLVSKGAAKKIDKDLENHLSEIVEKRKILEGKRNEIQSRLQLLINLENRIRKVLSERKKINEDLEKIKNQKKF